MTIFKKIIDKKIPVDLVFEDDLCLAFRDINPQAPTHLLLIPKKEIRSLAEADPNDHALIGHLMLKAAEVARTEGLVENGYRVVINSGADGGQTVDHLHLHIPIIQFLLAGLSSPAKISIILIFINLTRSTIPKNDISITLIMTLFYILI